MLMRFLLLVVVAGHASSSALPDSPVVELGGFHPVQGARGTGPASGYGAPPHPAPRHGGRGLGGGGGGGGGPTKTIYVNVPHPEPPQPLPPIAAGPPRKHYKIVFIRAPPPPPPPQPILPPRTEQKTLIYVLHRRPQVQEQKVINVPNVQHDPEVYFVQYDTPPSAKELQQLSAGNLQGYSVAAQHTGGGPGTGGVNRISALNNDASDEAILDLVADVAEDIGIPLGATGLAGSGSGEVPFTGLRGGGGGGGVPLPTLAGAGGFPSAGGGGGGVPLPIFRDTIPSTRAPVTTAASVGVPLPGLGGTGSRSSASVFPSGGSGLRVIGDDLVRPLGNTGFFQEVDDDQFDVFGNSFEDDYDLSFENRVGIAAGKAASTPQTAQT